jgi:hypothetical protein
MVFFCEKYCILVLHIIFDLGIIQGLIGIATARLWIDLHFVGQG